MLKKLSLLLLTACMSVSVFLVPVHAQENLTEDLMNQEVNTVVYDENGELLSGSLVQPRDISGVSTVLESGHKSNYFVGWHPAFPEPAWCNGYWLSEGKTQSYSTTIGIAYGAVSATFTIKSNSGANGRFYEANSSIKTKLAIYSSFNYTYYKTDMYDNYTGNYVGTSYWTSIQKTDVDRYVAEYYLNH